MFSCTFVAYEIVLADGCVVRDTKNNKYSDIFYAISWFQGTIGLIVVEIKLATFKEYIRFTYRLVMGNLKELTQGYMDFFTPRGCAHNNTTKVPKLVEGMIYLSTKNVFMVERYASKAIAYSATVQAAILCGERNEKLQNVLFFMAPF